MYSLNCSFDSQYIISKSKYHQFDMLLHCAKSKVQYKPKIVLFQKSIFKLKLTIYFPYRHITKNNLFHFKKSKKLLYSYLSSFSRFQNIYSHSNNFSSARENSYLFFTQIENNFSQKTSKFLSSDVM